MSDPNIQSRLDYMCLGNDKRRFLEAWQSMILNKISSALDRFYSAARATPQINALVERAAKLGAEQRIRDVPAAVDRRETASGANSSSCMSHTQRPGFAT